MSKSLMTLSMALCVLSLIHLAYMVPAYAALAVANWIDTLEAEQ